MSTACDRTVERAAAWSDRSAGLPRGRIYLCSVLRMAPSADEFSRLERFDDVDATGDEQMFIRFLETVEAQPNVAALRERSYDLLRLAPGARVADVGSGLGTATRELAERGFRALGFDASDAMVAEARRRAGGEAVEFAVSDVAALPVDDAALDGYRAERLYQHLEDPTAALAEARRVLRRSGRIVLVDQDWDTLLFDGEDRSAGRSVVRAFADAIRNPWIGRRYRALLLDAGFADVDVRGEPFVYVDPAFGEMLTEIVARAAADAGIAVDEWLADQRERLARGRFFCAFTVFVASADSA